MYTLKFYLLLTKIHTVFPHIQVQYFNTITNIEMFSNCSLSFTHVVFLIAKYMYTPVVAPLTLRLDSGALWLRWRVVASYAGALWLRWRVVASYAGQPRWLKRAFFDNLVHLLP